MLPTGLGTMSWSLILQIPICALRRRFPLGMRMSIAGLVVTMVDAGCFNDGVMAMGAVIRDSHRNVIMSSCCRKRVDVDPCTAEAMTIEWGLSLACHLNFKKIMLQSDAKVAVDCINHLIQHANLGPLVVDCNSLMNKFDFISVMFIMQTVNAVAHNLVGLGRRIGSRTWLDFTPMMSDYPVPSSFVSF
ncbi:unnamed protein product [Vicia faba]|uniref:RNase H type-1 domain-containing protein n=1 Tax=Vicia faba TaxID=3906 RepID=A0AAV0YS16_VICFA|nr:unnamed protein product [Vicia faba]